MHLVPGISKWDIPFIQLTKGVCGPFPGIGPVSAKNKKYGRAWAEKCIQHNDQVIKKITSTHSITHVIMGSTFGQYLGSWERQFLYKGKVIEKNLDLAIQSLIAAIETLRRAGKIPIVVSPPPRSGFNVGECLERTTQNAIVFRTTCEIALDEYLELDKLINDDLKTVVHKTDVPIIWLKDSLCDGNICRTEIDGTFIYLDGGHITVNGSEKILAPLKSRFFLPLNQKN